MLKLLSSPSARILDITSPSPAPKSMAETPFPATFLEAVPDAVVVVEPDGTIVQINSQAEVLFGYRRDELIGQKIEVLVPERYRSQHHSRRDTFAQAPKVRRMDEGLDKYGKRRDGSEFPADISLSSVSMGSKTLVLSAVRNISNRKEIEEKLRHVNDALYRITAKEIGEYRARLASIIDSCEDAIITKDLDGTIVSWNKAAERNYGYVSDEVVGKNVSLLAPADRPDEIPSILEKIQRGESVTLFESVRVAKDGRHLNVSVSVSPLRDASGKVVGASAIVRDTTAQKLAGDHLRHAQKMEAIGRLAGGVAHDVNNVLAIVMACTELLRGTDLNAESAEYVANIKDAVSRGAAMTRQLLTFSRKSVFHPQVLDLNQRLMEVTRLLHPLMGDEVEIVIRLRSPSALVEADAAQLDQMVLNLAVNSHDAMLHGGKFMMETTNVQVDETFSELHPAIIPGKYVLLAVSDTGVGMDAATVSHIFEPFFTTKEVGNGGGLGLATVHGIVQQIGGHIRVYSEPGHGTTFRIYLPNAENKVGVETKTEENAEVPKRPGTTILLVEDDPVILRLTQRLLTQHEYTVLEAEDGQAALDVARSYSERIDLVVTDVVMKRMSGPELAERLRISHPELKVIYMSGYTGQRVAAQEVSRAVITLVEKPFTRATLLRTVHEALG